MGHFEPKSQCLAKWKGVIFKLENKDGNHIFQWVREPGLLYMYIVSREHILGYTSMLHLKMLYRCGHKQKCDTFVSLKCFLILYLCKPHGIFGVQILRWSKYFINRKGRSSYISHLENHCHYDVLCHCRCQCIPLKYMINTLYY